MSEDVIVDVLYGEGGGGGGGGYDCMELLYLHELAWD